MKVLVDTNIWIDHLRASEKTLATLLEHDQVLFHPCVLGELALGTLKDRGGFLAQLSRLPQVSAVPEETILKLVEERKWFSQGIGWVDAQLLAACLSWPCLLWTKDQTLDRLAEESRVSFHAVI